MKNRDIKREGFYEKRRVGPETLLNLNKIDLVLKPETVIRLEGNIVRINECYVVPKNKNKKMITWQD